MNEWQLNYTDVDGRLARLFLPLFFGVFAAAGGWFLYLLIAFPPSVALGAAVAGIVLTAVIWLFGWLAVRLAVIGWRSGRGHWWLRLSDKGFEVNDRLLRPRRHGWQEIDKFMLVAPSGPHVVLHVGYSRVAGHRRSLLRRIFADFRDRDGTRADGILMGFWDRPFDEAVDLMNGWLARYRGA